MQVQVNKLDPAIRSLCFGGFGETNAEKRIACIEECLKKMLPTATLQNVEHVWTGPPGNRSLSKLSIKE